MGLIGQRIRRVEDPQLVRGEARYTGDVEQPDALELVLVHTTMAHARIADIDVSEARTMPGVVAVLTAADVADMPRFSAVPVPDTVLRPAFAQGVTRFAGEVVAAIVADTFAHAADAAETVVVDYEPLDAVVDLEAALAPGAPVLFDTVGSNTVLQMGAAAPDDLAAGADLVLDVWMHNQRVAVAPLEPVNLLVVPDGDELLIYASTQGPNGYRDAVARALGLDAAHVRLVSPAVGGGFGAKSMPDADSLVAVLAALHVGRAVRYRQTRTENLQSMHGRAQRQHLTLAARNDGVITALHAELYADGGAYPSINAYLAELTKRMMCGVYAIPRASGRSTVVATNTAPPTAYRGAGRPEAASMIERAVDILAGELGLDPLEVRRRNLIPAGSFPYTTPTGAQYDSGDYAAALDRALELVRYDERRAEQARRRAAGDTTLLGIGLGVYVEVTAGAGPSEFAEVEVLPDERVVVKVGTFGHGQGHKTTYAQIVSDALSVPFESIEVLDNDTAVIPRGFGTMGSRSVQVGGVAIHVACGRVLDEARKVAAELLEAAEADVVLDERGFGVAGVPAKRLRWSEVATAALERTGAAGEGKGLIAEVDWERPASSFPFGAHVAIVEVDVETGLVRIVEHVAVDDCGTIINPLLADGQVHGGIAQGAAQALYEHVVYDAEGNLLTSNLADYSFVSAAELPSFTLDHTQTPTPLNPLGAKGIGESGTIGSTPAVHNAVLDAISHLGVRHLDMPCTPERVWAALQGAGDDGRLTITHVA